MSALPGHPFGVIAAAVFCLLLAVIFVVKASIPQWRKKWGWGKGPDCPISVFGHIGISAGFLLISIGAFVLYFKKMDPNLAFFLPLAGFAVFIVTGLVDSHRSGKVNESR